MNCLSAFRSCCELFALALLSSVALSCAARAATQQPAQQRFEPPAGIEKWIQAQLKKLQADGELTAAARAKVKKLYESALEDLKQARDAERKRAAYEAMIQSADTKLRELHEELKKPQPDNKALIAAIADIEDLQKTLQDAKMAQAAAAAELNRLEAEPERRRQRRPEILAQKAANEKVLKETLLRLKAPAADGEDPAVTLARKTRLEARELLARQTLLLLEKEQAAYDATAALLPLQRDQALRVLAHLEDRVARAEEQLGRRRTDLAEAESKKARQQAAQVQPALRPIAQRNLELADRNRDLLKKLQALSESARKAEAQLAELKKKFKLTREKVEQVGQSEAMGWILRKQREKLPSPEKIRRRIAKREQELRDAQVAHLACDDARAQLAVIDRAVEEALRGIAPPGDAQEADLRSAARALLDKQKSYLDAVLRTYNEYFEKMVDLNNVEEKLIQEAIAYAGFIDERILWVRSQDPIDADDLRRAWSDVQTLVQPTNWLQIGQALANDAVTPPFWTSLALAVFAGWIALQGFLRHRVKKIGEQTAKGSCQTVVPTLQALVFTALIAAWGPALLYFVGWRLREAGPQYPFALAFGRGTGRSAELFFYMTFFLQVCRSKGLGEAHFGWRKQTCALVKRHLTWFTLFAIPCGLIAFTLNFLPSDGGQNALGRLCLVFYLALIATFAHFLLRPGSVIYQRYAVADPTSWVYRSRYVWYGLSMTLPLALCVLTLLGYRYTAGRMVGRVVDTVWLVAALLVLQALLTRWLLVVRRRLAFRQLEQRRAAATAELAAEPAEPQVDYNSIGEQSRKLLRLCLLVLAALGIWHTWGELLPALHVLHHMTLWQVTAGDEVRAVTLAHLAAAILLVFGSWLAVKNIPGLLELLVLQRLPLDAGARYAVCTLLRYVMFLAGVIIAFELVGVSWTHYQWIVAAATVGLGFGLQEIFANFVSGVILLLERPIRVGDVVTVGEVTGKVTRISMRSTIITDWDNKEFVVPNKDFVTGRVLNWTLSDPTTRVSIEVGVEYASDPEKVREILLQVAQENPLVLKDPPPSAGFDHFGDSSLNFVLRCYLPNLDNLFLVRHQLRVAILKKFREAKIEIPFPQRDIHIQTAPLIPMENGSGSGHGWPEAERAAKEDRERTPTKNGVHYESD